MQASIDRRPVETPSPWWRDVDARVATELQLLDVHCIEQRSFDLIVIGSGIAGLSCAAEAAGLGLDTLVLEKQPKIGLGVTGRNAGILNAGINAPLATLCDNPYNWQLWKATAEVVDELASINKQPDSIVDLAQVGAYSLARSAAAEKRLMTEAKLLQSLGVSVEFVSSSELRRTMPAALNLNGVYCGMRLIKDGRVQPLTLLAHFARVARSHNATIAGGANVDLVAVKRNGDEWTVPVVSGTTFRTKRLVYAIGPRHQANARLYAMAYDIELPPEMPVFWDANPYIYYDFRPGNARLTVSGGRYGKAGGFQRDYAYHRRMAEATQMWLPMLKATEPSHAWAVDLAIAPGMVPAIREVDPEGTCVAIEGLGALGVLPGIVLGRRAARIAASPGA